MTDPDTADEVVALAELHAVAAALTDALTATKAARRSLTKALKPNTVDASLAARFDAVVALGVVAGAVRAAAGSAAAARNATVVSTLALGPRGTGSRLAEHAKVSRQAVRAWEMEGLTR